MAKPQLRLRQLDGAGLSLDLGPGPGQTHVFADSDECSAWPGPGVDGLLSLLLPTVPSSLIATFEVTADSLCRVINLSSCLSLWVGTGSHKLAPHQAAEVRAGDIIVFHSARYVYVVDEVEDGIAGVGGEKGGEQFTLTEFSGPYASHALELCEFQDWLQFFGHVRPTLRSELKEDGSVQTSVHYDLLQSISNRDESLSFYAVLKRERVAPWTILPELLSVCDLGHLAFLCLRATLDWRGGGRGGGGGGGGGGSGGGGGLHLASLMTECFHAAREGRLLEDDDAPMTLPFVLAYSLRKLPADVASQLLLDCLIEPAALLASLGSGGGGGGSDSDEQLAQQPPTSQLQLQLQHELAGILLPPGRSADLSHTISVLEALFLLLVKLALDGGDGGAGAGAGNGGGKIVRDLADLVAWRARHQQPSSAFDKTGDWAKSVVHGGGGSPVSVTDAPHVYQSPSPQARKRMTPDLAALLHENARIIGVVFCVYNSLQRHWSGSSPARRRPFLEASQEMSLATLRVLMQDLGLDNYFDDAQLRAVVHHARGGALEGDHRPRPRHRPPAFASPTRAWLAKNKASSSPSPFASPPPATFSWGAPISLPILFRVFAIMGEHPELRRVTPGGIFGMMNAAMAGKKLGLRNAPLFSLDDSNTVTGSPRWSRSPSRHPSLAPSFSSTPTPSPRKSPSSSSGSPLHGVRKRLF